MSRALILHRAIMRRQGDAKEMHNKNPVWLHFLMLFLIWFQGFVCLLVSGKERLKRHGVLQQLSTTGGKVSRQQHP